MSFVVTQADSLRSASVELRGVSGALAAPDAASAVAADATVAG